MKKLTEEESVLVAENHNLIYWIAHFKGLNLDEWYDLLAIELCATIRHYNPSRGSLSNYYKMRVEGLMSKEYRRSTRQKRIPMEQMYDMELQSDDASTDDYELSDLLDWIDNSEYKQVIKLKAMGYTQKEIGDEIGFSQTYISFILKEVRKQYEDYRQSNS